MTGRVMKISVNFISSMRRPVVAVHPGRPGALLTSLAVAGYTIFHA
jgi:hypothetical protein